MRFRVDKLIRDRLPDIMRASGLTVFDRRMEPDEFIGRLKDKLVEEAAEARAATSTEDLIDELADVQEVVVALLAANGLTLAEVEDRRLAKRTARGGFDERIYNAAVEAEPGCPAAAYYLARPSQYPLDEA